jgi:hypothetical protein
MRKRKSRSVAARKRSGMARGYPRGTDPNRAGRETRSSNDPFSRASARIRPLVRGMANLEDFGSVESESPFAEAIREHLELKARNSELDGDMPLDPYLDGDPLENHPLFKSEEQARIEETMDGEPAAELSSERLPWPGEETVENVEGAVLDEALWTGRPRDFDWGD